jgi:hypothetical protein
MNQKLHPLLMAQRMRRRGLGAMPGGDTAGQYPAPDGSPGSFVYPYGERPPTFGQDGPTGVSSPPILNTPDTPAPAPPVNPGSGGDGLSIPYGSSTVPWQNPTTVQSVPILATTPSNTPVLSLNMKRNLLIIQNNSSAGSGNTAPNFYVGFNAQPQIGLSLTLTPGAGILFDIICPRDSIYITVAGGAGTFTVAGVVVQGTYAPLS